jgi:hypothetical protein
MRITLINGSLGAESGNTSRFIRPLLDSIRGRAEVHELHLASRPHSPEELERELAAAVVTMHSVGGKEVLSRLQGVLSTLGLLIPPMSAMTYSLAGHVAARSDDPAYASFRDDFWQQEDLEVIGHNLLEAASGGRSWKSWNVDRTDAARLWI